MTQPRTGDDLPDDGLFEVAPRWVTLRGEYTDEDRTVRAVTLIDEAVALGAPFDGFVLQVGVGVPLGETDGTGQPTADERAALRTFEQGLVQALGRSGRLVATLTVDGLREYVAYLRDTTPLLAWREDVPAGMDGRDWQVQVMEDPAWLGLRELAGLLPPGHEELGPLTEVPSPDPQA